MAQYLVTPLQELQFGDGRAPEEGGSARSVTAPRPSTLLGALRTAFAAESGVLGRLVNGTDDPGDPVVGTRDSLGSLAARGPLVCTSDAEGVGVWLPCPADLEVFDDGSCRPLVPVSLQPGDGFLGIADRAAPVVPVALKEPPHSKPAEDRPAYVPWAWAQKWLEQQPGQSEPSSPAGLDVLGRRGTVTIRLVNRLAHQHVTLTPGRTAQDGGLFATEHCEVADLRGVGWWVDLAGTGGRAAPRLVTLGGQQGLASVSALNPEVPFVELLPPAIEQAILRSGGYVRILVLTPAILAGGSVPRHGIGSGVVRAACVPGHDAVSGSRMRAAGHSDPRPARRAVPPGSTFVVEYPSPQDAVNAARELWFRSICDAAADRQAGFGLVAVGGYPFAAELREAQDRLENVVNGGHHAVCL